MTDAEFPDNRNAARAI